MSVSGLAIVAALVFGWGTLPARLERFDVTAPITFVAAGLLLTHGPLVSLGIQPSNELIKSLAEFTLVLVLFSDASRVGLHELRQEAGLYLRLLGVALPLTIGLGALLALALAGGDSLTWQITLYAILSLTVIRMLPVAVALIGARLDRAAVVLVGWFGPRGLASVVFALLALEELGRGVAGRVVTVITITVVLSVLVHGATADPLAAWYARRLTHPVQGHADGDRPGIPERRLVR